MKVYVSTGNSRMEKRWNGGEMELEDFVRRISRTVRTAETVEQYRKLSKARQDSIKDVGGFVMGKLKGRQAEEGLCGVPVRADAGYGPCRGGCTGADGDVF